MLPILRKVPFLSSRPQNTDSPAAGKSKTPQAESAFVAPKASPPASPSKRPVDKPESPPASAQPTPTHPEKEAPPSRWKVYADRTKALFRHPIYFTRAILQDAGLPKGFPGLMDKVHRLPVGPNTYAGLEKADRERLSPKYPVSYQIGKPVDGGKDVVLSVTWGPGLLSPADRQAPGPFDYTKLHDKTLSIRDAEPGKYMVSSRRPHGGLPYDPKTGEPKVPWKLIGRKYEPEQKPLQATMGQTTVSRPPKPTGAVAGEPMAGPSVQRNPRMDEARSSRSEEPAEAPPNLRRPPA